MAKENAQPLLNALDGSGHLTSTINPLVRISGMAPFDSKGLKSLLRHQ